MKKKMAIMREGEIKVVEMDVLATVKSMEIFQSKI